MNLLINGRARPLPDDLEPAMPLLWVLRDVLHLTGTKYGCGVGACGACTVLVDGQPMRACVLPLAAVTGSAAGMATTDRAITTIEGLGEPHAPHALQQAWIEHQVPQCGYCQSGLLMAAQALLERKPRPSDADIEAAITGLCRCGSLARVKAAVHDAAARLQAGPLPARSGPPPPAPPVPTPATPPRPPGRTGSPR